MFFESQCSGLSREQIEEMNAVEWRPLKQPSDSTYKMQPDQYIPN